jgi:DNA/RNA-binding domain of Phe-tRNA-synthetase-like protein
VSDVPALAIAPHPALDLHAFAAALPVPIGALGDLAAVAAGRDAIAAALDPTAATPLARPDDATRAAVRDLLRHGGFKPTGRSKPASEYLAAAAADGRLRAINPVVDAGNAASLHGGLPISVVDLDRVRAPLAVAIAPAGAAYVFNPAGQAIDVGGLIGLLDADGPCANAVKDAQRSKTDDATRRVLVLVWSTRALPGRGAAVAGFARGLLAGLGAAIADPPGT